MSATVQDIDGSTASDARGASGLGVESPVVTSAYDRCAEVTRTRARNFYYGLRLLPDAKRRALYSIYAWMRAADDAVDGVGRADERAERLARFREETNEVLGGGGVPAEPGNQPVSFWPAFAATVARYPLEPRIFLDTLAGMDDDLRTFEYQTDAQLSVYCSRVASTVGIACLRVWGLREGASQAQADALAELRGQAFQRTNILRDFKEDFDETPARVYLPREAFARHQLTAGDLRHWRHEEACRAFIVEQAAHTRSYYSRSAELEGLISPDCCPTLWAMTRIYSGILRLIEERPERVVLDARVRLSSIVKTGIALRASARAKLGRW